MRTLPTFVASGLLIGVLAGCGSGDPEPKLADPTPSPVVTSSSSVPTSDPPTSAASVRETPEEFIERWQEAAYMMQISGDTATYKTLVKQCVSCDALIAAVESAYADGGYITLRRPEVNNVNIVGRSGPVVVLEFDTRSSDAATHNSEGAVVTRYEGGLERFQVNLKQIDGQWYVIRLSNLVAS